MSVKMKTHKGARKRFKVSASGKVKFKRSFAGHLLSGKTGRQRRQMRRPTFLTPTDAKKIARAIGN